MTTDEDIRLHRAGATVRHVSPFSDIEVPVSQDPISEAFVQKWVRPFYSAPLWCKSAEFIAAVGAVHGEIDEGLVVTLLSYFNWRPRKTGACFAAVKKFTLLEDHIGRLLLRSDVSYAAIGYCLALARFNTPSAVKYLREYLDYYLTRPDLWFDQGEVMAALGYLDRQNGTNIRAEYLARWEGFIANKPNWSLAQSDGTFEKRMATILRAAR